ncbi:4-hydroxybenzoyl-CoA thioesterase [Bryobacterales bacterium F-183]|nr:4-hydroxybenzoyl-CoA thioesterase [Bryobacterales bacterium F-183]
MRTFDYVHVVGFEETNLVGNVYFANHIRWQGRVREMFLRQHAPSVLEELSGDLALVTVRCGCDYLSEIYAFDQVRIRLRLGGMSQNRVTMLFEYWRCGKSGEELAAKGEQQIACMKRTDMGLVATPIPSELRNALQLYAAA